MLQIKIHIDHHFSFVQVHLLKCKSNVQKKIPNIVVRPHLMLHATQSYGTLKPTTKVNIIFCCLSSKAITFYKYVSLKKTHIPDRFSFFQVHLLKCKASVVVRPHVMLHATHTQTIFKPPAKVNVIFCCLMSKCVTFYKCISFKKIIFMTTFHSSRSTYSVAKAKYPKQYLKSY